MRSVHDKSNKRTPFSLWTKDTGSRQFSQAASRIMGKLRVVLENCRASDHFNVIDRRRESDCARDVWRAAFEPVRRFLECAVFERDAYDHLATAVPRRHRIQKLRAPVKHADASRCTHFVSGER